MQKYCIRCGEVMYYRQSKQKKRRNIHLPFDIPFKIIGIVLFVAILIAAGYFYYTKTKGASVDSSIKAAPFDKTNIYSASNDYAYYVKDGNLHILDSGMSEKKTVQLTVKGEDLKITSVENVCVAYNSSYVQVLNTGGSSLFLKEFSSDVNTVHASKSYVGVLRNYDTDKKQNIINIYDYTGKEIDKITLTTQYVLDFGFSTNGTNMWILAIDTSSATAITKITNYNVADKTTTAIIPISGQIISRVSFSSKEIYAIGLTHSQCYSNIGDQVSSKSFLIYGFNYLDSVINSNGNYIAIFAPQNSTTINILRLINGSSSPINIQMPPSVTDACVYGDNIYAFAGKTIYKYNLSGTKTGTYDMKYDITNATKIDNSPLILLETSDGLKVFNLK